MVFEAGLAPEVGLAGEGTLKFGQKPQGQAGARQLARGEAFNGNLWRSNIYEDLCDR